MRYNKCISRVTRPMFNRVVRLQRNDLVETCNSSWFAICRRPVVSDDIKAVVLGSP